MAIKNIVLVHGAWADGSSWSGIIAKLQADGYTVTAPQFPLTSLADDVARLREVLAEQTEPTLVAAHSYGGEIVSALGEDTPNLAGLVFVSAFALAEGETLTGFQAGWPQLPVFNYVRPDKAGFVWLNEEGFLKYFAADIEPVKARVMCAVQQPFAYNIFGTTIGTPGWKNVPNYFFISENDQVIPPEAQHFMAERIGAKVASVAGSHVSLVSHFDAVGDFIKTAAEEVVADKVTA